MLDTNLLFTLEDIADWKNDSLCDKEKPQVYIPKLQRGLVWKPDRIELLWDSLLRGIPVGTFSVIKVGENENLKNQLKNEEQKSDLDNTYLLLDGQQRANAIALGFDKSENPDKILWIDLAPGKIKSSRKFYFYVTTKAQPWGYEIKGDNSTRLDTQDRRKALSQLNKQQNTNYSAIEKPAPQNAYPFKAVYPVPFTDLANLTFNKKIKNIDENILINFVKERSKGDFDSHAEEIQSTLKNLKKAFEILKKTRIFALEAPADIFSITENSNGENDDDENMSLLALYFQRMNEQGVVPSREDIDYSILKANFPDISFDEIAKNRMKPARLANLALRTYKTLRESKWSAGVSRKDIALFCREKNFEDFAKSFRNRIEKVDKWLVSDNLENHRMLPFHRTLIAQRQQSLYQLLLVLAEKDIIFDSDEEKNSQIIVALTSTVAWFSKNLEEAVKIIYDSLKEQPNIAGVCKGLFVAARKNSLVIPPSSDEVENLFNKNFFDKLVSENLNKIVQNPVLENFKTVSNGFNNQTGRLLLLYSCREYMKNTYKGYDPAESEMWEDVNCPWDYDHILPQSWLGKRGRSGNGPYMDICRLFLWSIGNSVPIHFSINRSKNDAPPGKDYCKGERGSLFISDEIERYDNSTAYDRDYVAAQHFITTTAKRAIILYSKWFDSLPLAELLHFDEIKDASIELQEQVRRGLSDDVYRMYYYSPDKDVLCEKPLDYAHDCLTLAKQIHDAPCMPAITIHNGSYVEIGLRIRRIYGDDKPVSEAPQKYLERLKTKDLNECLKDNGFNFADGSWWLVYRGCNIDGLNVDAIADDLKKLEGYIESI